jgi:hypothetical protein
MMAYQTTMRETADTVARHSAVSIEQVHSIKTAVAEGQAAERKARQKETEQLRRQLDDLNREIPTVTDAVETLRSVSYRAVVWLTGLQG